MKQQILWVLVWLTTLYKAYAAPPITNANIRVDQFGYLQNARKVAVIVNPQLGSNAGQPFNASTGTNQYQVRRWNDDAVVFSGTLQAWANGATQASSGDKGWWFDFSVVNTPGSYYIFDVGNNVGSYRFDIGDQVYNEVLKAAVRTYFYQRINFAKQAPYTDPKWADVATHEWPGQDRQATSRYAKGDMSTAKDLHGGWMDAGDMNKYVTFAEEPVALLLEAYRLNPAVFGDDFNIPESGNGIPDILDEVKYELDFIKRMQDATGTGGLFLKVGVDNYDESDRAGGLPPSADRRPRYYLPECTASTLSGAAMFAVGAAVFRQIPSLNAYAQNLIVRAEQAFNRAKITTSYFSSFETACDDQDIRAGDADKPADIQRQSAVVAAIYLFEVTGKAEYKSFVDTYYNQVQPMANQWWGPYTMHVHTALLRYAANPAATPSVANAIRAMKSQQNNVLSINDYNAKTDLYRAYMADAQYHWGSNQVRGNAGVANLDFVNFSVNPAQKALYREIAAEYLHWFHGVNAQGKVMMSNMGAYGAEDSMNEIYHTWFQDGTDWDNALTSSKGPAPGYVPGGPNHLDQYDGTEGYLRNEPLQKRYKDWNGGFPENSWILTEVAIYNQAPYVSLLSRLIVPTSDPSDTEPPTTPTNLVASGLSPYSVKLTWNGSTDNRGVTAYEVYQDNVRIAETPDLSLNLNSLSPGTSYTFTVKAVDFSANRSEASNAVVVNTPSPSPNDFIIYGDAYKNTITKWSWNAVDNPDNTDPVKSGQKSIKADITLDWGALSLRSSELINTAHYPGGIQFWYFGSEKSVRVTVNTTDTAPPSDAYRIPAEPNTWTLIRIPWSEFGNPSQIQRISFGDGSGGPQTFYLDDIRLVAGPDTPDTQAPTAPTSLTNSNVTQTSMRLSWNGSTDNSDAVVYEILRGNSVIMSNVSSTSIDLTGLTCNNLYELTVRAKDASGNLSPNSNTIYVMSASCYDGQAPTVPTNLVTSNITTTGLILTWTPSTDNVAVSGYEVFRDGTLIADNVASTSLAVGGLTCHTGYTFTVRAKDAMGNRSALSNPASVTTTTCAQADTQNPTVPTNLVANNVSTTGLTLTWNASTDNVGVTAYEVYQNGVLLNSSVSGTTLTVNNLACGTTYTFAVLATDAAGNKSAKSATVSVSTPACPPLPPSGSEVIYDEALNSNWQEWGWSVSTNYTNISPVKVNQKSLAIQYSDGWGGWAITRNTHYVPTPQTTIRFWVYATTSKTLGICTASENEGGVSPYMSFKPTPNTWQEVVVTMPQLANPAKIKRLVIQSQEPGANLVYVDNVRFEGSFNVSASNVTVSSLRLNWTATSTAATYDVYQNGSLLNGTVSGTQLAISGLTCGTGYTYSVIAKDATGGVLATSVPVSVSTAFCAGSSTVEMIYDEAFNSAGWDDWSWGLTKNYDNATNVKAGQKSAALTFDGWGAWSIFRKTALPVTSQSTIRFWIYATTNKTLALTTYAENDSQASSTFNLTPTPNTWQEVVVTMPQLGNPTRIKRLVINMPTFGPNPIFLDNVRIETPNGSAREATSSPESSAGGHLTISPNPADGPVRVQVSTTEAQAGTFMLLAQNGMSVQTETHSAAATEHEWTPDVSKLAPGVYIVQWQSAMQRLTGRLVVIK